MTLPKLPYWTRYTLNVERLEADLAIGRTLEPYHLLVLGRDMLPWLAAMLARKPTDRLTGSRRFEHEPSRVASPTGQPARQRVRYES